MCPCWGPERAKRQEQGPEPELLGPGGIKKQEL